MPLVTIEEAYAQHDGMHDYGSLEMDPLLWSWIEDVDGVRWRVYFIRKRRDNWYIVYTLGVWRNSITFEYGHQIFVVRGDAIINDKS